MTVDAKQFAGSQCGCIYERELQPEFQDRLFFYVDGKIRFERACYGEAAGLVFEVWGSGFDKDGNIIWINKPKYDSYLSALPDLLTDIQDEENALQFDGKFRRFLKVKEITSDTKHGYTRWKLFRIKHFK